MGQHTETRAARGNRLRRDSEQKSDASGIQVLFTPSGACPSGTTAFAVSRYDSEQKSDAWGIQLLFTPWVLPSGTTACAASRHDSEQKTDVWGIQVRFMGRHTVT